MATAASIKVEADVKDAIKAIKSFEGSFTSSWTEINSQLSLFKKGFDIVKMMTGAVIDLVKASNEQVISDRKLEAALSLRSAKTDENIKKIKEFNDYIQQNIGYGDEALQQLQTMLLTMGVNTMQLGDATKATIGLSEATGQGLGSAAKIVAKAMAGEVASLKEYGIYAKDASDATKQLSNMFLIAENKSGSAAQKMDTLSANLGDLKQALGETIGESGFFKEILDKLNEVILTLISVLQSEKLKSVLDGLGKSFKFIAENAQFIPGIGGVIGAAKFVSKRLGPAEGIVVGPHGPEAPPPELGFIGSAAAKKETKSKKVEPDFVDDMMEWVATQRRIEELDMEALERKRAIESEYQQLQNEHVFQMRVAAFDAEEAQKEHNTKMTDLMAQQVKSVAQSGIVNTFAAIGEGIASENANIGDLVKKAVGSTISTLGVMLIQMGVAGEAAAVLGTAIPIFAPLTGGPAGIAASVAAIAAGTALVAVGSALGGSSGSAGRGSAGRGGAAGGSAAPRRQFDDVGGFKPGTLSSDFEQKKETPPTVINVNFSQGMIVGTQREIARSIKQIVKSDDVSQATSRRS